MQIEEHPERIRGGGEISFFPELVSKIETVYRVAGIALQRLSKIVDGGLQQIGTAFCGPEIIEYFTQRYSGGDHLKCLLCTFVIAGLKTGEAEQEAGFMR